MLTQALVIFQGGIADCSLLIADSLLMNTYSPYYYSHRKEKNARTKKRLKMDQQWK